MIGSTLGHFSIESLLGEGGMGAVYRAVDTRLGRQVAIKVLPGEFTTDPDRLTRFEREAQLIASLNHPNICALYDVGHAASPTTPDETVHYLVMELVDGESLGQRIARGMTPDEAVGVAIQIAEALEAAHARGIVHRDLKPANVMINSEGTVKVLDFGLAKVREETDESRPDPGQSPTLTHRMTQAGMVLGTAGYMSPEQTRGNETDQRSDIWAWGVILHEMLVGKPLFEEPTVSDTLAAVLRADIGLDALPDGTPRRVRAVLRRCLERDPKNRLHAIADARIELRDTEFDEEASRSIPIESDRSIRLPVALALVVGLIGIAVGVAAWWTRPATSEPPLRMLQVAEGRQLSQSVISPDGTRVVLARGGRLYLRRLDSRVENEIPGVEDVDAYWTLFWSPDGRRIGYTTPDAIYTVPVDGGAPRRVCEIPDATFSEGIVLGGSWWGPDTLVFALDARGLWQVPATGGEPEILLQPDREDKQEAALHFPHLLPDGKTLAARVRWKERPNDTITFLRDGKRTDVTFADWSLENAVVTSSGYLVFVRIGQDAGVWATPFSSERLQTTGEPVRVMTGGFRGLSIAADETLVTMSEVTGESRTVLVDREGTVIRELVGLGGQRDPAVSPDGSAYAFWGIRVHDGRRTIDVTPDRGRGPTWSPDGREIIYETTARGLLRVPADGSRDPVVVIDPDSLGGRVDTPHWSPDGRYVAFCLSSPREDASERDVLLNRDVTADIAVLDLSGSGPPQRFRDSPATELYPRFSPDGKYLAYASDVSGRFEIYVTPFPGGDRRWQVSVDGGRFPRWSATGDEIFFVARGHLMATSFSAGPEVTIGAPHRLISSQDESLRFSGFGQSAYDVTPDGRFVVMQATRDDAPHAVLVQSWPRLIERSR